MVEAEVPNDRGRLRPGFFCEAEILDEEGEMVAKALGSFKHRKIRHADLT